YGALDLGAEDAGRGLARVRGFREKGRRGAGAINAGIYWFGREVLDALPARAPLSLERDALPGLAAAGELLAFRTVAPFLDIGTPDAYAAAAEFFAACERRRARPRTGLLVLDRDGTLIHERP